MTKKTPHSPRKRAYEKPVLHVIELKAEETLAVPCKISFGAPGSTTGCGRAMCKSRLGS
jgi:hypothetical protein